MLAKNLAIRILRFICFLRVNETSVHGFLFRKKFERIHKRKTIFFDIMKYNGGGGGNRKINFLSGPE